MLRSTLPARAPVYCLILDNSRIDMQKQLCRKGVGFNTKIDLGFAVTSMEVRQFQRLIDEHFKKVSPNFHTVTMGQVFDQHFNKVITVHAFQRYYVGGSMKNGYIKSDVKYNTFRLNGQQGNYSSGLKWGGEKW